jgi:MSHA biogenesis protein MshJ
MKSVQAQIDAMAKAKKDAENSPLIQQVNQLKQQLAEGETYLNDRRDKLVPQEKMAKLLELVLNRNGHLQLIALQTLPVSPLIEAENIKPGEVPVEAKTAVQERQIFKHGVQITVRGSYADLTEYLSSLEHLPARMFWGMAKMNVVQYPTVELTLTLYTLSMDKVWMQV